MGASRGENILKACGSYAGGGTFEARLERLSKISIPIGGTGFIIEILATANEEADSERAASGRRPRK